MAYNIGDRVGDYEIIDVLGAGGHGQGLQGSEYHLRAY